MKLSLLSLLTGDKVMIGEADIGVQSGFIGVAVVALVSPLIALGRVAPELFHCGFFDFSPYQSSFFSFFPRRRSSHNSL